jgi:hypothetical protein
VESDNEYININPQDFVVLVVARVQRDLERVAETPSLWWFVIQDLDLALTAQLVAFLSGTMQIGALKEEHQNAVLAYLNDRSENKEWPKDKHGNPLVEQLASFPELLRRTTDATSPQTYINEERLKLSKQENDDILKIHRFRNQLAHIKPTSWSLEIIGLPRMTLAALKAIRHLFEHSSQIIHLNELDINNCKHNLQRSISTVETIISNAPT